MPPVRDAFSVLMSNQRQLILQCDECGMWRLLYSRLKLTKKERSDVQQVIEDVSFTCGAPLQDSELPGRLNEVLSCGDPIEKLYITATHMCQLC